MKSFLLVRSRLALLVCCILFAVTLRAAERRPNFLFVYTDDQRWDAMSVVQREQGDRARYPWFKTPHMDRIAAEGIRFRNAFVTLALCAPSRATFLTGRYNRLNGVIDNQTPLSETSVTHASLLRDAGYTTGYIGKWHMGMQRGQRPGFSYSASFVGQGKYFDSDFEINGVATPTKGWIDDVSTDFAIEFLKQNRAKPFSLVVGFKTPHVPLTPPERAKDRFAGEVWRTVPNMNVRAIYRNPPGPKDVHPLKRPTNLAYFRCVSAIDDCVGRLLATLDELGLADDTVVIFTSDNGYYQGEHGLGDKRSAYEESIRIPLVVRYPKRFPKGKPIDEMVLNLDVAPTFLELAGLPARREFQGRSWVPLIAGKATAWRDAFFYEYYLEAAYPTTPTVLAVRTPTAKLITYPGREDWTELFDLKSDPYELKNLARDPAHAALLAEMTATFAREQAAAGPPLPGR
jgi:arylsulfatase A-like enzyme